MVKSGYDCVACYLVVEVCIPNLQDSREPIREHGEWLAQEKMEREFRTAEGKKRRGEPAAVTQVLLLLTVQDLQL